MGQWGFYGYPSEPPSREDYFYDWLDEERCMDNDDLDIREEQGYYDEVIPDDDSLDYGAWLETGEIPLPNTG